ncbi:MAG: c-type cytochrome, partial [Planctomycetia bacterium]
NAGYGSSVRAALERRSDLLQIHYAYVLRTLLDLPGSPMWTAADRGAYYAWFARAREWAGGNSFQKFITRIEDESLATLTENERLALETLGIRRPYVPPPLPKPVGPGRQWSVATVLAAAEAGLGPGMRDFEKGRRAFAAARCVVCHRFDGDGGATGPDLTQAGGRFQVKDLVEAIVEPSRVVSDQYKASVVQTADGRVITGRVVAEDDGAITIVTDPEDATTFARIARADIEAITPSAASLMPAGLLDQLNEDEVLDLLAYALSRGNARDKRFRR